MTGMTKVLVVEDSADIRRGIAMVLNGSGLEPIEAADGRAALKLMFEERPDCVVLDIGLPDLDGLQVLTRIRDMSNVPVLILTARHDESDKVDGLEAGADDYMSKPFGNAELVARVNALVRRSRSTVEAVSTTVIADGSLIIDSTQHRVLVDGAPVSLTSTDFRLLWTLAEHRGQVLTPGQLLEIAWRDPTATSPDRVKFAVYRLRQKLGAAGLSTHAVETVRGVGYRYCYNRT